MRKNILLISVVLIPLILWWWSPTRNTGKPKAAILQTASHPALDRARKGFTQAMHAEFGNDIQIVTQNAEGLLSQARTIAKRFHLDPDVKVIFTIGSLATQIMAEIQPSKPIVFCAVTDPSAFSSSKKSTNLTGCCDMINVDEMVQLVKKLTPSAQTISLLFCPSELSSVIMGHKLKTALEVQGLKVVEMGLHLESEANTATTMAASKSDVIVTPTDNLVAATIPVIARQAIKQKTPLIVSDNLLLSFGPLAAKGVDYEASGRQAASMVTKLLREEAQVEDLPIQRQADSATHINMTTLSQLSMKLPADLMEEALLIHEEL